jgi:hypothetical protein
MFCRSTVCVLWLAIVPAAAAAAAQTTPAAPAAKVTSAAQASVPSVPSAPAAKATPAAQAPVPSAGRVKVVSGAASIVRDGKTIPAFVGQDIIETDVLQTGPDGHLGVTLKDETRLSLDPDTAVRLDKFRYGNTNTDDGSLALVLKFMRGAAAYVSGRIAKLSPDAVRLETPSAIVGVRGTSLAVHVVEK